MSDLTGELQSSVARRADALLLDHQQRTYAHTDRLFAFLMALQWVAGIVAAILISPRTWSGSLSQIHIHVWTAVLVGGAISSVPIGLALLRPGRPSTRYVIAAAQMLTSALLIHLSGGRVETHFHVFGSLAFLAFYRDWKVFIPATLVIATDHMVRGLFWPQSVFGVLNASQWRWVEHAAWVLFEDAFLMRFCYTSSQEMRQIADRRAQLEATNEIVEAKVQEQTAELRDREELFRSLSTSSPVGVFRCDAITGRFSYANEQCCRITGLSPEEILAEDWTRLIHTEDLPAFQHAWRGMDSRGESFVSEFRLIQSNGAQRWIRFRASRADKEAGIGVRVGTLEDITPHKLAAAREASFDRIFEESSNEIYIFNADTLCFLRVNRGGRKNTGYTMAELEHMTPLDLVPHFTRAAFLELLDPLRNGHTETVVFNSIHRRKDSSTYSIEARLQLSLLDNSPVIAALILDVSARKAAEEERDRMLAAVEQATESVVITDVEGVIQYANPAFESVAGATRASVVGRNIFDIKGLSGVSATSVKQALGIGNVWRDQLTSRRQDGPAVEIEITISVIRDAEGTASNWLTLTRDITETKSLELQLRQAQKLESIGQLAAGIAHEINTPTQYVGDNTRFLQDAFKDLLGPLRELEQALEGDQREISPECTETLRKSIVAAELDYLTDEIPRAIGQSLEGIQRVTGIVRAMKDFSHPGADKKPLDLNKAIESTITVARNEWKYVAELETDFDDSLGLVVVLPGEWNQVVLIMIVNAAHAIAEVTDKGNNGKGTIRVSTKRLEEWAEIRISDTGCGIPADIHDRIFDQFFTTKDVGEGTGQGLSIAHNVVVQKHGGRLTFESEVGQGTTFVIQLPLPQSDEATVETST